MFRGIDSRGVPHSFFKEVSVAYDKEEAYKKLKGEPYKTSMLKKDKMKLKFGFYGWLKEPEYVMELDKEREGVLRMVYDPKVGKWGKSEWV